MRNNEILSGTSVLFFILFYLFFRDILDAWLTGFDFLSTFLYTVEHVDYVFAPIDTHEVGEDITSIQTSLF